MGVAPVGVCRGDLKGVAPLPAPILGLRSTGEDNDDDDDDVEEEEEASEEEVVVVL